MQSFTLLLSFLIAVIAPVLPALGGNAVAHRGVVYVALDDLLDEDFLNGTAALTDWARVIDVQAGQRRLRFLEGADRVAVGESAPVPLHRPVLVLDGRHYIPVAECAPLLGYSLEAKPRTGLTFHEKHLPLDIEPLDTPHLRPEIEQLEPVSRVVVLTKALRVRRHLHEEIAPEELPAGTVLLVRRLFELAGIQHAIVTRSDESLESYAIGIEALDAGSTSATLDGTHLGRLFGRLTKLAADSEAIDHGPRQQLSGAVALTADLCWSLKPYERDFFRFIPRLAEKHGSTSITLFMTGRWLGQHPEEMERLIELSREPGVGVIWALHSWSHPKERPFMNSYPPEALRADALRLEHDLLEWGIVPSIYYRFPGLVHDEQRLRTVLGLNLISVDCDSWIASMRRNRPPHHLPPRDGSILLVHGNGNEPAGISRLYQWMIDNPQTTFAPLNRFISPDESD